MSMLKINNKKSLGFTLAEVLITLGIIGTVAAMTIPTLINNIDKSDKYSGLLKALSVMSEASALIRQENGNSMAGLATDNTTFMNLFVTYLKPIKICNANDYSCYLKSTDTMHELKGGTWTDNTNILREPKIVTADGFVYIFNLIDSSCQSINYQRNGQGEFCGYVFVDINGTKEPNTMGKDIFAISINKYNTTPFWNMITTSTINSNCNPSAASGTSYNGINCGAKAILDGGIKYY